MPTDLVIFDCDGVLIDSEIISARMLVTELAGLGVQIDLDYVAQHFLGRSYPAANFAMIPGSAAKSAKAAACGRSATGVLR